MRINRSGWYECVFTDQNIFNWSRNLGDGNKTELWPSARRKQCHTDPYRIRIKMTTNKFSIRPKPDSCLVCDQITEYISHSFPLSFHPPEDFVFDTAAVISEGSLRGRKMLTNRKPSPATKLLFSQLYDPDDKVDDYNGHLESLPEISTICLLYQCSCFVPERVLVKVIQLIKLV